MGKAEIFLLPVKLYLIGGEYISRAVAEIVALVDLPVVIMDDWPEFANSECFPHTREIIYDDILPLY